MISECIEANRELANESDHCQLCTSNTVDIFSTINELPKILFVKIQGMHVDHKVLLQEQDGYHLQGVIFHQPGKSGGGHYTGKFRTSEETWVSTNPLITQG